MSNISQNNGLFKIIPCLVWNACASSFPFTLAVLTRGLEESYLTFSRTYITMLACILFFHLLSYYMFDWNTNIFKRGYYVELIAVLKYNSVLILMLSFFLYVSKMSGGFLPAGLRLFLCLQYSADLSGTPADQEVLILRISGQSSSNKVFVITTSDYADDILGRMLELF